MSIINAVMVPHPPLIVPEVGRGEQLKIADTVAAYETAAEFVARAEPETVIILTPHSAMYYDWFHISPGASASGSFSDFGARGVRFEVDYDAAFVAALCERAHKEDFPAGIEGERNAALDHATMTPLYFLKRAYGERRLPPIVRIGLSGLPLVEHYRLGMLLESVSRELGRRVSAIASGDLSHRLKSDGPYGLSAEGPQYDERIMDVMGRAAFGELFDFGDGFCEAAGECGHRAFTIMAGCFDGRDVKAQRLSYEGPFGVGYGVCLFESAGENDSRRFLDARLEAEGSELSERKAAEDEYVRLARLSVETYVKMGREAALPEGLSDELLKRRAGVFVSLHERGRLRGCIGTTAPTTPSVAREILQNGVSACSRDPRFPAVEISELPLLEYSVDVLGEPQTISSPDELDAKRYGVIVTSGFKRGLLLPDLEGVDTVAEQIAIAKSKAGIREGEDVTLERFEVARHV